MCSRPFIPLKFASLKKKERKKRDQIQPPTAGRLMEKPFLKRPSWGTVGLKFLSCKKDLSTRNMLEIRKKTSESWTCGSGKGSVRLSGRPTTGFQRDMWPPEDEEDDHLSFSWGLYSHEVIVFRLRPL